MGYLVGALAVSIAVNMILFVVAFRRQTDKLTDASYAISFILLGFYGLAQGQLSVYRFILFAMIVLWAARLGGFLLFRIWQTGKDSRFDAMRGNFWKFGKFWLSQGLAVWVILIPSLLAFRHEQNALSFAAAAGLVIWLLGLVVEAAADIQKYNFSANPANKGKWIASGIWRYSRHPNYFGEIVVWLGVYLYALSVLELPEALVGLASPLFIAGLLLFVSGIPILEKSAGERWGRLAGYRSYKRRTSLLIPWPPRKL